MSPELLKPHPVCIAPPNLERWADSNTGTPYVHERSSGLPGADVLLTCLIHGNEYSGAIVLSDFLDLELLPRKGRITVAFCNVAAFNRFDPDAPDESRYVAEDLNRVWSLSRLDGGEHNVELQRARQLLPFVERATHLLDLHSMHEPCSPLLVTGTLPRNVRFAQELRAGATVVIDEGHADGVRMRDYGAFADTTGSRISLLLEAGQHWATESVNASRDVLMRFLVTTGAITNQDVPSGWVKADAPLILPISVTHRVVARSASFTFTQAFTGLEIIDQRGTVIANDGDVPVVTPYDDCILVMPSLRQLKPGVTTVRLGRREALAG